jgi:hypothetical protein
MRLTRSKITRGIGALVLLGSMGVGSILASPATHAAGTLPSLNLDYYNYSSQTIAVNGSGFTAGGTVVVSVFEYYPWNATSTYISSGQTQALYGCAYPSPACWSGGDIGYDARAPYASVCQKGDLGLILVVDAYDEQSGQKASASLPAPECFTL